MKFTSLFIKLAFISLLLVGCGTSPYQNSAGPLAYKSQLATSINKADIKPRLMAQYKEWRGAPYRHGGLSKRGVDCSGFVYLTYLKQFGIKLPRSTEQQSLFGVEISPNQIRPGDLVFFKSMFTDNHVGIYLGNRRFLHASTSQGVMISTLDNDYWRDKFWKAQRI